MQDFTWKTKIANTKGHWFLIIAFKLKNWEIYISGILHIKNTKADLEKKVDNFINDKATLITHISLSPTLYLYPIHWKKNDSYHSWHQLDSGMIKMNQDVMSTRHSKCFFSIYIFRTFIINIDCGRILTNIDNSTYDYNCHIQKIMILQVIQQICCEMLIGGG